MTSAGRANIRLMLRDGGLWGLVFIAAVTSLIAGLNGRMWQQRRETIATIEPTSFSALMERRVQLPPPGRAPASDAERSALNAFGVAFDGHYTALPAGPLAGLAIGRSDAEPVVGKISLWTPLHSLFPAAEPINPMHLWLGQFDPAFLVVYILPLLLLGASYDIVSREAEDGTLTLLRAQPVSLRAILWRRLLRKAIVIAAPVAILPPLLVVLGSTTPRSTGELTLLAGWFMLIAIYAVFWLLMALIVNAQGWSSASNGLILIAIWLALTVAGPQVASAALEVAAPQPDRLEYLQALRHAQTRAEGDVDAIRIRYFAARPDTRPQRPQDGFIAPYFLQMWSAASDMAPVIDAFEAAKTRQERVAERLGLLSPALIVFDALTELAGSSARDLRAFRQHTRVQHEAWHGYFAPPAFLRQPMTGALYEAIPRKPIVPRPASVRGRRVIVATSLLGTLAIMLCWAAFSTWRRAGLA